MFNSISSVSQNTATAFGSSVALDAATRPSLGDVLRDYQVNDDSIIDYSPRAFGSFDIPFTNSRQITKTEGELLDNLTSKEGLLGLYEFKALADSAFSESTARYPYPASFPPQAGTSPRDQHTWAQNDGHRDAFRHAFWNARMTSEYGVDFAEQFGTAHEAMPGNNADREAMDLYNNEVGRQIAVANPDATPDELADLVKQAVTDGKMIVIDSSGNLQWSDRVAYGDHGIADDSPGVGQLPIPNGNAYPNASFR